MSHWTLKGKDPNARAILNNNNQLSSLSIKDERIAQASGISRNIVVGEAAGCIFVLSMVIT